MRPAKAVEYAAEFAAGSLHPSLPETKAGVTKDQKRRLKRSPPPSHLQPRRSRRDCPGPSALYRPSGRPDSSDPPTVRGPLAWLHPVKGRFAASFWKSISIGAGGTTQTWNPRYSSRSLKSGLCREFSTTNFVRWKERTLRGRWEDGQRTVRRRLLERSRRLAAPPVAWRRPSALPIETDEDGHES